MEKIILPEKLESIGDKAFQYTKISELVVPSKVKEISSDAFLGMFASRSTLQKIVFEGSGPIKFSAGSVGVDCIIMCKGGSALMEMLEKQNADLEEKQKNNPKLGFAPRKLEEV